MKNKIIIVLALLGAIHFTPTASAQGTAFTYQGQLQNNGSPANGRYDLMFTLYTNSTTGNAIGGPVTNSATAVTNGLFTITVDFGAGVFTGGSNWLSLGVRTNATGSFTTLAPRQQVTPAPYAITAGTVTGVVPSSQVSGTIPLGQLPTGVALLNGGNIFSGNQSITNGSVGIGTNIPSAKLAVAGVIESTTGGIEFPDGTTQTTAAQGIGAAQFIRNVQSPNNSVPPGTAFTIDTQVFNNIPGAIAASSGSGGTVFTLTAGLYVLDYEMSLASAGSVGLYTGSTASSLALDTTTIAGSSTATTWIHGRALLPVASTTVFAVSSVVGTASVVNTGTAFGNYLIRLTILKLQ
jgi:hypothetical protein